jgi:tetratricopeptide (TPR) repeat protein
MLTRYAFCLALLICTLSGLAQEPQNNDSLNLVMPEARGRIVVSHDLSESLQLLAVYDNGHRPVAQFTDKKSGVEISYILFPNFSGKPNGDGCREDVIEPLLNRFKGSISNVKRSSESSSENGTVSTASYFIAYMEGAKVDQQSVFGFLGDAKVCAEAHLSKSGYKPADEVALQARLSMFQAELSYTPTLKDYFMLATMLFKNSPGSAAPYYKSALALLPAGENTLRPRRILTDQLAMSLGMSGKLPESRAVLEAAIVSDPNYPLNYYNLACADAEQGDAAQAKVHLQQAFDRKENVIQGESLPDPTKDESLLKLKGNASFWALAKSLSPESR